MKAEEAKNFIDFTFCIGGFVSLFGVYSLAKGAYCYLNYSNNPRITRLAMLSIWHGVLSLGVGALFVANNYYRFPEETKALLSEPQNLKIVQILKSFISPVAQNTISVFQSNTTQVS